MNISDLVKGPRASQAWDRSRMTRIIIEPGILDAPGQQCRGITAQIHADEWGYRVSFQIHESLLPEVKRIVCHGAV